MPNPKTELWLQVKRELGYSVSPAVRRFCELRGWVSDWEQDDDPKERADVVTELVKTCQHLRDAGLGEGGADEELAPPLTEDGRWELIRELRNDPDYRPIRISQPTALELSLSDMKTAPQYQPVRVEFDGRVSLNALSAELRKAWPEMKRRGWVKQSRPLGSKALALIRHVCLDLEPGASWGERRRMWNERFPEWEYTSGQALSADFRRAETALTKETHGLEVHHNPWATADIREIKRAARAGDQRARHYLMRRLDVWERGLEALAAMDDDEGSTDDGR
ncbi:hypothetical protein BH24CHL1_BH24CHL1_20260 [soil metagenome]